MVLLLVCDFIHRFKRLVHGPFTSMGFYSSFSKVSTWSFYWYGERSLNTPVPAALTSLLYLKYESFRYKRIDNLSYRYWSPSKIAHH